MTSVDSQDQVTGNEAELDDVTEKPIKNTSEGDMCSTDEYPPLVCGDVSNVTSQLDKTWVEVAVRGPTHISDHVKPKPRVTKPSVNSNVAVARSEEVLDSFDETSEEEESVTNPFSFLMKVPRCDDAILQEQIDLAKLQVDEKSRLAGAIQAKIQEKRANIRIHHAKDEDRKPRSSLKSKRMEINSLMSVISKGNDALFIEDINRQLEKLEHKMQHETLDSKQEKKIISEIKQLKQQHEELLAFLGSQDEIKQALEQRDEAEDRLKVLRKEIDILKDSFVRADATAAEAEKKRDAENREMKELQAKCRAANDARQSAYVHWQSLKTKLSVKNKHYFQYKDDAAAVKSCAFSENKKALHHLCTDQVEKLMQLWNTNDEFRQEYVKSNARSTIRRLGTLDGRSLGPGEQPHVLPVPQERVDRMMVMKSALTVEAKKSNQESELIEKAEEKLKREDAEAKTKEQRRLEELTKAEAKAHKEAEEKEKARRKRLRKKENKKANKAKAKAVAAMEADEIIEICETTAESSKEDVEISEKLQRQLTRTVVPPSLRSRSLRSYRQLMWTGLISFVRSYSVLASKC